jgi:hypothetical protein
MKMLNYYRMVTIIGAAILMISIAGCSSFGGGQSSPPPNPVSQPSQANAMESSPPATSPPASSAPTTSPPASTSQPPSPSASPRPQFYDFQDIPIPTELDLVSKDSYVFQSGSFKAGLLTLKGRVDVNSLINFFQMALPRENWKPKGGFRYKRSVLIFEKPDKTCIINLYEKTFYTYVEILVAPSGSQV